VDVDLGGGDVLVAHDPLQCGHITPTGEKPGGQAVSQQVGAPLWAGDSGVGQASIDDAVDGKPERPFSDMAFPALAVGFAHSGSTAPTWFSSGTRFTPYESVSGHLPEGCGTQYHPAVRSNSTTASWTAL